MRSTNLFYYVVTAALLAVGGATGQSFDTSGNGSLKGDYFVREVLIGGQNSNGTISSASSALGIIKFDGAGNYTFTGQTTSNGSSGAAQNLSRTSTYKAASNGLFLMTSLLDTTDICYGGISALG